MPTRGNDYAQGPLDSPGFWLHHAALSWRRELERALAEVELTPPQFIALSCAGWLSRAGDQPTQQEVADLSGGDRMMTSRLLRTLEERGLLTRATDPSDARVMRVALTAEGRRVVRVAVPQAQAVDGAVFGGHPGALTATLRGIAERSTAAGSGDGADQAPRSRRAL